MFLKLYIDTTNRRLIAGADNDLPADLPALFREDTLRLIITLCENTGNVTSPVTPIAIDDLDLRVGIGLPDQSPEVLQETWTKDLTAKTFTADVILNTTDLNNAFSNASGQTLDRLFEVETERSSKFHTVLQQGCTLHKDILTNPLVAPSAVTSGSAFANSFAATADDSETIEWTKSGDLNYPHIKGLTGITGLTAGDTIVVKSDGSGFELSAPSTGTLAGLTDTSISGQSSGDNLQWNGSAWAAAAPTVGSHQHALGDLSNVDTATSAPTSGQMLAYDGTNWVPSTSTAQNLFLTVQGDSGSTQAASATDTLQINGGDGVDTAVSGNTVTISGEVAGTSNKGIASFEASAFTVSAAGHVDLQNISLANGGTGASTAEDAFDNLSPLSAPGDLLTHDGSDNIRLPLGTAAQVLAVNAAANGVEWVNAASGGGGGSSVAAIDDLSDVDTSTAAPSAGDLLEWDGTNWVPTQRNEVVSIAASDESTALTVGTAKTTFRMPFAMNLSAVRASLTTAPAGADLIVDINAGGSSVLSTKLSIDDGEATSTTAATAAVISTSALADDAEIKIDVDQIGSTTAGAGLKIHLIGARA